MNRRIKDNLYDLEDLEQMDHYELSKKLQIFKTRSDVNINQIKNYVITTDNFLKMCVIYVRVQAQIPVVIMGETGCGKTTLLQYFCETVRNEQIEIFNIHAGVTYD